MPVKESSIFISPRSARNKSSDNNDIGNKSGSSARTTYLQLFLNIVPRVNGAIPEWLIQAVFGNLAFLIVEQIRRAGRIIEADKRYEDRATDPSNSFYSFIRRRIQQSFPDEPVPVAVDTLSSSSSVSSLRARVQEGIQRHLGRNASDGSLTTGIDVKSEKSVSREESLTDSWVSQYLARERRVTVLNIFVGMRVRFGLSWPGPHTAVSARHSRYKRINDLGGAVQDSSSWLGVVKDFDLAAGTASVDWSTTDNKSWFSRAQKVEGESGYRVGDIFLTKSSPESESDREDDVNREEPRTSSRCFHSEAFFDLATDPFV